MAGGISACGGGCAGTACPSIYYDATTAVLRRAGLPGLALLLTLWLLLAAYWLGGR